jgi:hypothetical protein
MKCSKRPFAVVSVLNARDADLAHLCGLRPLNNICFIAPTGGRFPANFDLLTFYGF